MAELYCRNCGQPLRDTDNFCPKCGTRVNREAEQPSEPEKEEQAPAVQPEDAESGAAAQLRHTESRPQKEAVDFTDLSGEEEIRKNHRAFHIDDFDWGNSDYPTGHPHKTEDVDFNWNAAPSAERNRPLRKMKTQEEEQSAKQPADMEADAAEEESGRNEEKAASQDAVSSQDRPLPDTDEQRIEHDLDAIDTFYTYSQKNEEFQKVLNKEYDRIRKEAPAGVSGRNDEPGAADAHVKDEPDSSPEETLHKLEELAKKAQTVTAASSRAAEAASEMYGEEPESETADSRREGASSPDAASGEAENESESPESIRERAAKVQDALDRQDAGAESGSAGGAAEPASAGADMDYVFDPQAEEEAKAKKKKRRRRHIGLKIFVAVVIVLIVIEAGFLILRKFAPDSILSIQLEKFFMRIADVIYSHFG